jgi:mRNA interferase MazF
MSEKKFLRGDVVWINCYPSVGVEPKKIRTCVVVSNDVGNEFGQAITVFPTQKYSNDRAGRAYMVDLRASHSSVKEARVTNASMIMTYDRSRVVKRAGASSKQCKAVLDKALRVHLML